jgi:aspartate carbamoyltransferase catalytic subunit
MPYAFPHRHLLDIERLSKADIEAILDLAAKYAEYNRSADKKMDLLRGRSLVNLFFENSTRTRTSFELAAKRLGMDVVNVPVEHSSTKKGETLLDTVLTLDAMRIDALAIRHAEDGVPQFLAPHVKAHVINAGDGKHEHPTQALLDALTVLRHKKTLQGLTFTYCGDLLHSRVAGSFIRLLAKFGNEIRVVAPASLLTKKFNDLGVKIFDDVQEGVRGADVVMTQRIQLERLGEGEFKMDIADYHRRYGLNHERLKLAKPDVIVLDPGPVVRDMTISSELADDTNYSVIREQVEMGVAVRMAVLELLLTAGSA